MFCPKTFFQSVIKSQNQTCPVAILINIIAVDVGAINEVLDLISITFKYLTMSTVYNKKVLGNIIFDF